MPAPPLPRADLVHISSTFGRGTRMHGGGALAAASGLALVVLDDGDRNELAGQVLLHSDLDTGTFGSLLHIDC